MNKHIELPALEAALRRAFSLGQTYWQQADSEYSSQHKKADETLAKFKALIPETLSAIAAHEQARVVGEPVAWQNQCDGCAVGAPINEWGNHKYEDGSLIACTKDRYAAPVAQPATEQAEIGHYEEQPDGTMTPVDPTDRGFKAEQAEAPRPMTQAEHEVMRRAQLSSGTVIHSGKLATQPTASNAGERDIKPDELTIEMWPPQPKSGMIVGMSKGVKITHLPTGISTTCDSERSQHQNRDKAYEQLRAALASKPVAPPARELRCTCGNEWEWNKDQTMWELAHVSTPPAQAVQEAAAKGDKALLDFLSEQVKGDTTICPPGQHGGADSAWLVSIETGERDRYGAFCNEHEGATLRDAIRAASDRKGGV